jgi:hypothetical protein
VVGWSCSWRPTDLDHWAHALARRPAVFDAAEARRSTSQTAIEVQIFRLLDGQIAMLCDYFVELIPAYGMAGI